MRHFITNIYNCNEITMYHVQVYINIRTYIQHASSSASPLHFLGGLMCRCTCIVPKYGRRLPRAKCRIHAGSKAIQRRAIVDQRTHGYGPSKQNASSVERKDSGQGTVVNLAILLEMRAGRSWVHGIVDPDVHRIVHGIGSLTHIGLKRIING